MKSPKLKKPTDCSAPVVSLAVSNPIITHEQLAAQDFEPSPEFVTVDPGLLESHEDRLKKISVASRMAIATLGFTKAQLIERTKDDPETCDSILKFLSDARELTEQLADFIKSAELRHAVALANVCAEDGSVRSVDPA